MVRLGSTHVPAFERFVRAHDPAADIFGISLDDVYRYWRMFLQAPAEDPAARKSRSLVRCLLAIRGRGERPDRRRLARAREAAARGARCEVAAPRPSTRIDVGADDNDPPLPGAVRTLLRWAGCPPERPRRAAVRGLCHWMTTDATWSALNPEALAAALRDAAPDGPGLGRWVATVVPGGVHRRTATRRLLLRARMHPEVDRDGVFARHTHAVPQSVLLAHPDLCAYPAWFGRYVAAHVADADRLDVIQFTESVADGRMLHSGGGRCPGRMRRSVASGVRKVLTALRGIVGGPGAKAAVMHLLPRNIESSALQHLVAQIVAYTLGRGRCTGPRRSDAPCDGVFRSHLHFFRGAIRNGVFEPSVPCTWRLAAIPVQRIMLALERSDPARWRAHPWSRCEGPPRPLRMVPTAEDVEALRAAASGSKDPLLPSLFVELLVTTGIRAEAFANLRWMHLWTEGATGGGEVRVPLCIPEKNSDVRRVTASTSLRWAIQQAHDAGEHDPRAFVFLHPLVRSSSSSSSSSNNSMPWLGCARTMLLRLCRVIGLQGHRVFTPHQFRAYLVNAAMAQGCHLDAVSKWFGHRNVNVTYRYYWTAPAPLSALPPPPVSSPRLPDEHCSLPLDPPIDEDPLDGLFGGI